MVALAEPETLVGEASASEAGPIEAATQPLPPMIERRG